MKTVKQIKLEAERQADLKQLKLLNDYIEWLELVIERHISGGKSSFTIQYDLHHIDLIYEKLLPIMQRAGYKVTRYDYTENVGTTWSSKFVTKHAYNISWE